MSRSALQPTSHFLSRQAKRWGEGILRLWVIAFVFLPLLHSVEHYKESRQQLVSPFATFAHEHQLGEQHEHSHHSAPSDSPAEHGSSSIEHQQCSVLPALWWWKILAALWERPLSQTQRSFLLPHSRTQQARAPPFSSKSSSTAPV